MANISSLPNELLVEIWRHVLQPEDIESFALASRKILAVSGPFLLEHRKLKIQFSAFDTGAQQSKMTAAGLLKEITTSPHVALYVTSLKITSWRRRWDGVHRWYRDPPSLVALGACQYVHQPYVEKDMISFKQAAKRAEGVSGNVDSLIEGIKAGKEDPIVALLLLQLTNLKHLDIYVDTKDDDYHFRRVLQYVSNAQGTEALRQLNTVGLLHRKPSCSCNSQDLWFVKAFATLPSVKDIKGRTMEETINHRDLAINVQPRSSNVETLTFVCYSRRGPTDLDTKELFELIEGFKALKTFIYTCQLIDRISWVHAALVAHAKHSLETLILESGVHGKAPIGSFRGFEVLKKLELDHAYLIDDRGSHMTRLADKLPSSLEELHVHDLDPSNPTRLDPLGAGQEILEDKDTHLPNLTVVVFCDDFLMRRIPFLAPGLDRSAPGIADLQAACNAKGFRLEIPKR